MPAQRYPLLVLDEVLQRFPERRPQLAVVRQSYRLAVEVERAPRVNLTLLPRQVLVPWEYDAHDVDCDD